MITNEFGIKFTKLNIDKQISEHSTKISQNGKTLNSNKPPKQLITPSLENSLGLSIISTAVISNKTDSDEADSSQSSHKLKKEESLKETKEPKKKRA